MENIHGPLPEKEQIKTKRNWEKLEAAVESAGVLRSVMERLRSMMEMRDNQQGGATKHFTQEHNEYVERVTAVPRWETEVVRCRLDTNPKGSAVLQKRTYFAPLYNNFVEDKKYFEGVALACPVRLHTS